MEPIKTRQCHRAECLVVTKEPRWMKYVGAMLVLVWWFALRSNIKFIAKAPEQGKAQVIAVTSSVEEQVKTFLSINLASVFSLGAHKVVLVGVDLRKPKIFNAFGLSNDPGLSNYLAGHCAISKIIQNSGHNNLGIIVVVPPNPSELIQGERFSSLIQELKNAHEYVILNTLLVGLVADALQVTSFLDAMLYVVRYDCTQGELLTFIE